MSLAVLCLMFLSTVQVALSEECPEGWELHGNKCYKHSDGRATWHNALEKCESEGGTLANIADESIDKHLQRNDNRNYWIGLSVTSDKLDWLWNDGSTFVDDEFQWDDGNKEPNGQHTCARIQDNDKLGDKECEIRGLYFICQADKNPGSWSNVGGYWFFFSDETKSQYEASNYCITEGGYLARKDVLSALEQRVQMREYWIGLSRRYWLDGSLYLWNKFMPASSDNSGHCFFMYNSRWDSESCSEASFYICQMEKQTSSTTTSTTTTTTTTTAATILQTTTVEVTPPQTLALNNTSSIPTAQTTSDLTISTIMESRSIQMSTENPTKVDDEQYSGIDSVVLYILIGVCVLIAIMVVVIIVLVVLFRRRANRTPVKEKLQTDAGKVENQQTVQLPAASSQANAQDITNDITAQNGTDAGPKQPTSTASNDAPIYAVPNKKKI